MQDFFMVDFFHAVAFLMPGGDAVEGGEQALLNLVAEAGHAGDGCESKMLDCLVNIAGCKRLEVYFCIEDGSDDIVFTRSDLTEGFAG